MFVVISSESFVNFELEIIINGVDVNMMSKEFENIINSLITLNIRYDVPFA